MRQININRNPDGTATYDESGSIPLRMFFHQLRSQEAHSPYLNPNASHPTFATINSVPRRLQTRAKCPVPPPADRLPYLINYGCKFHPNEQGTVHVFPKMAVPTQLAKANNQLPEAIVNLPLPNAVQLVVGGKSPYAISGQMFQVTDSLDLQHARQKPKTCDTTWSLRGF